MRIYNDKIKPVGSLDFINSNQGFTIKFGRNGEIGPKFTKLLNKFLEDNNLKLVNSVLSDRKHCNHKTEFNTRKGFKIYTKHNRMNTDKSYLKLLESKGEKDEIN